MNAGVRNVHRGQAELPLHRHFRVRPTRHQRKGNPALYELRNVTRAIGVLLGREGVRQVDQLAVAKFKPVAVLEDQERRRTEKGLFLERLEALTKVGTQVEGLATERVRGRTEGIDVVLEEEVTGVGVAGGGRRGQVDIAVTVARARVDQTATHVIAKAGQPVGEALGEAGPIGRD